MPKSKEELNELKKRYENLTEEIRELSEEELKEVTGGDHDFVQNSKLINMIGF